MDTPQRIAAIAEQAREGYGASVLGYVQDWERAFAIPILHISEYTGLSADELGGFHPPQGYVRLDQHLRMLRLGSAHHQHRASKDATSVCRVETTEHVVSEPSTRR